jgi:hypothetical protein
MALNKIQKFIRANTLDFSGSGSDLNSNCCTLSGYALHLGLSLDELVDRMTDEQMDHTDSLDELVRVFKFAESHGYGEWWKTEEAELQYEF